jgi:hypothetical protein
MRKASGVWIPGSRKSAPRNDGVGDEHLSNQNNFVLRRAYLAAFGAATTPFSSSA